MATSSQIADLTCCAICLETFTRPKMLPCQHTYCYSCLLSLGDETTKTITCPQCRKVHKFPEGGIANFNDDIMANNLVGMCSSKEDDLCADCKLQTAVSPCEHCNANMCVKCIVQHVRLSLELELSFDEARAVILAPRTTAKREELASAKNECLEQLEELKAVRNMRAQDLLERLRDLIRNARSLEHFMKVIIRVYDDVLRSSDKALPEDSYVSSLASETNKRTTADSLKDLKNEVGDVKNILHLLQRMGGDRFRFVPLSDQPFGRIEFGQAVVDVQGTIGPGTDISLEEITELFADLTVSGVERYNNTAEGAYRDPLDFPRAALNATDVEEISRPPTGTHQESTITVACSSQCDGSVLETFSQALEVPSTSRDHLSFEAASLPPVVSTPIQVYRQNQLPKNVDYHSKGRGWIPIIGRGKALDKTLRLSEPRGIAYHAANDEIYVADYGNDRIMVYSRDGSNARRFYDVVGPQDVAISADGAYVYIAAGVDGLIKVTLNGEHVKTIKSCSLGELGCCVSVVCHQKYTVLLDGDLACVFVYENDREIRHFGRKVLEYPEFISISEDGTMYVTDNKQPDIKVFRWNGQYLRIFPGSWNDDWLYGPTAVDADGYISVANVDEYQIEVYDPNYNRVATIGGPGKRPGRLNNPLALCFMSDGKLVIADKDNNRLQIL